MGKTNQKTTVNTDELVNDQVQSEQPTEEPTEEPTEQPTEEVKVDPLGQERIDQLLKDLKTKSAVIRFLAAEGHTRRQIADAVGVIYQHVRNVLVQAAEKAERAKK